VVDLADPAARIDKTSNARSLARSVVVRARRCHAQLEPVG
jgi:hypothetical protein